LNKILIICRYLSLLLLSFTMVASFSGCGGSEKPSSSFISTIEGEVQIKKVGSMDWVRAAVKAVLVASDTVKTGANSKVSITFFDGSIIELKSNTQIEMKELVNVKTKTIRLKQDIGETLSKVEKLTDSASRYEIETPTAIAGVRGSSMLVSVAIDGTTIVKNLAGQISVSAQGVEVTIPVGNASTVRPGQPPVNPVIPNATDDFSTIRGNPNGSWSYGWMSTDFSKFNLYTTHNSYQWYGPLGGDRTPCIWINTNGMSYGVPTGWLSLHPGPGKEPSVLRWIAPVAGNIQIIGQFLPGDSGNMIVAVRHKSEIIWTATNSGSFDLNTKVAAGDTIDFAVYGGYGFGNTPISATISYGH
jgi:hypothetical protein